jgi:hypothetical protein
VVAWCGVSESGDWVGVWVLVSSGAAGMAGVCRGNMTHCTRMLRENARAGHACAAAFPFNHYKT